MDYRKIPQADVEVSTVTLGTWSFASDRWWGHQKESDSISALTKAMELGVSTIDTAPAYGRGNSEKVIGKYLKKSDSRQKVVLATKLGLSWKLKKVYHDLSPKRMRKELDESRKRLQSDVIDLYQVHWPDPDTPIQETAETMREFYEKGSPGLSGG